MLSSRPLTPAAGTGAENAVSLPSVPTQMLEPKCGIKLFVNFVPLTYTGLGFRVLDCGLRVQVLGFRV